MEMAMNRYRLHEPRMLSIDSHPRFAVGDRVYIKPTSITAERLEHMVGNIGDIDAIFGPDDYRVVTSDFYAYHWKAEDLGKLNHE